MSRIILTAALATLWLIAFDTVPASVSNTPALSGAAHAGPKTIKSSKSNTSDRVGTVKSSKSNTSDRKGGNKGGPPTGIPGGRGY